MPGRRKTREAREAKERRIAELGGRVTEPFVEMLVRLPRDVKQGLRLIRQVTGIPMAEWVRWQIIMAVHQELARRPGALWLRPGSTVYRLVPQADGDLLPHPIGTSLGGERVWVIDIIPDVFAPIGTPKELFDLEPQLRQSGVHCDLTADEPDQLEAKRVCVPLVDVMPRESYPWRSGLGSAALTARRQAYRRKLFDVNHAKRQHWALLRGESAPPVVQPAPPEE